MERNTSYFRQKYPKIRTPPELAPNNQVLPDYDFYDPRSAKDFHPILAALRARYPSKRGLFASKSQRKIRVLQVAGGHGQLEDLLEKEGMEPVVIDLSRNNLVHGKKHVGLVNGMVSDARTIPIKGSSVDAVVSDHFFLSGYLLDDERKAVAEARRVLKKDGILVLHKVLHDLRLEVRPSQLEGWKTLYDEYPLQGRHRTVVLQKT